MKPRPSAGISPRTRHIPLRTCVACRTSGDKRGLIRVVRQPDGTVAVDPTGKANGRGAYVCIAEPCILTARKQKKLDRSLKVAVPPEVYEALLARVNPGSLASPPSTVNSQPSSTPGP